MITDIFKYTTCKEFLRDYLLELKRSNPRLSQRNIAIKIGIDPSFFSKIINGTRRLSYSSGMRLAQLMKLSRTQKDFFELLIRCDLARSTTENAYFKEKIKSRIQSRSSAVKPDQSSFYSRWYNAVIRELINVIKFNGDYDSLSKMIIADIKPQQIKSAVLLLEQLQIITRNETGTYSLTEQFITADKHIPIEVIHDFQSQMIDLAKAALFKTAKESREISTVTLSLSEEGFQKIRQRIAEFRNELFQIAHDDKCKLTGVYQINFQAFPVASTKKD